MARTRAATTSNTRPAPCSTSKAIQREVIDALDRVVMRYDYDMLRTRIHQASMEAGERWMLNDVTGKPIRAWNSRKYAFRTEYDALRRPVQSFVQGGDPSEANPSSLPRKSSFERTIYGDSADTGLSDAQQQQANLRAKVFRHFDGAGVVTTDLYDFKGNSLRGTRQFASDYKNAPDWSQNPALESEIFTSATAYDALNRAIAVTTPDSSIYRPTFNEANLLETVDVNLRGALGQRRRFRHQYRLQRQGPAHAHPIWQWRQRPTYDYDEQDLPAHASQDHARGELERARGADFHRCRHGAGS